ncbi:MAG: D-mannonate epimerase, partial [Spirochaetes bacterium]|nr:D-mannonate epimerase [Spirochaetota bacterium]
MIYFERGSENDVISYDELKKSLFVTFDKLGKKNKVIALPPDFTRFHSQAGIITRYVYEYYKDALSDILPTLGTHSEIPENLLEKMFGDLPRNLFRVHNWRTDVVTVGTVPADFIKKITDGKIDYPWPAQVNKLLINGNHDLILSIGQIVPHEVIGMANYNKNIFV